MLALWLRFLRPERKFSGVEELRAQIEADREAARIMLQGLTPQEPPTG